MKLRVEVPIGDKVYPLDLERSGEEGESNRWIGRGRIPCTGAFSMDARRIEAEPQVEERSEAEEQRGGGDKDSKYRAKPGEILLEGIASSTSVDWHGTEMSIEALQHMQSQFKAGVPYVPSHRDDEWDQVFGMTVDADIERGAVLKDAVRGGPDVGHLLRVKTSVYQEDSRASRLLNLLDRGATVGWSIGGWFTDMEVITNDQDEVERMIIKGVELDHLAVTRRPSNPDSWIYSVARSVGDAVKAINTEKVEERHIVKVEETEDHVKVTYGKSEDWDGMYSTEGEEVVEDPYDEAEGQRADASEPENRAKYDHINFSTPKGCQEEAERGLKWVEEGHGGDGLRPETLRWARKLARGEDISPEKARKMRAWLARHESDKKGEGFTPDEDGFPSAGRVAWALWCGDPGVAWSKKLVRQMESADEENREVTLDPGIRAATAFANLPLAPLDMRFNKRPSQMGRLQDNILGTLHGPEADWGLYRKAHLWYDADKPREKSSYKLLIARMYDPEKPDDPMSKSGTLHVFLDKVRSIQERLDSENPGIPDDEIQQVRSTLDKYIEKFNALLDDELVDDEEIGEGLRSVPSFSDLPFHEPMDDSWSFTAKEADEVLGDPEDWDRFKKAHAYFDPDNAEIKGGYKLPFAKMSGGNLKAYWRGVVAAMAAINGSRGGVDISDDQRKKAYDMLSRYYDKADKEPPEFNQAGGRSESADEALDITAEMGEKSTQDDAHRSAEVELDTVTLKPKEERVMSDDIIEETAPVTESKENATLEAITRSMGAMEALLGKLVERDMAQTVEAPQETPVVEEAPKVNEEAEMLRARITEMESKLARMASRPVRSGYAHNPADVRSRQPGRMGEFIRTVDEGQGGASVLAAVCKEQAERRESEDLMQLPTRNSLEKDLRTLLEAAVADGVITTPDDRNGWR